MHKDIKNVINSIKIGKPPRKMGNHLRVHICVCAPLRVFMLVQKSVDMSRWCLNAVMVSTSLCSVVFPGSIKKSPNHVCELRSAGFKGRKKST